ncbi:MAG: hypothetical protein J6N95_02915 [Bacilli bacterium]|nr:hypothetical protein [Bacilli bacterium]
MFEIPTTIELNGKEFNIRNKGDYRTILDCFAALEDAELDKQERLFASLIIFYEDIDSIEDIYKLGNIETAISEMYKFFNCGSDESSGRKVNYKLMDWKQDEQLIASAVNKVAGTEVRSIDYLHWWTFMGYYSAIGKCPLSTILNIRDKIVKGKKLEKEERTFRQENPQYFVWNKNTVEEEEADRLVKELWNSGD